MILQLLYIQIYIQREILLNYNFPLFSFNAEVNAFDCETFTVSVCINEDYEIEANLPPIQLTEAQCQDFCELEANCLRYKFTMNRTSGDTKCQFFTRDYSQECASVGGTQV